MSRGTWICVAGGETPCECETESSDIYSCSCELDDEGPVCVDCGADMVRICLNCSCTEDHACQGGCAWSADDDYCTRCHDWEKVIERTITLLGGHVPRERKRRPPVDTRGDPFLLAAPAAPPETTELSGYRGLIDERRLQPTPEGLDPRFVDLGELPLKGEALFNHWISKLDSYSRQLLSAIAAEPHRLPGGPHPVAMSTELIAERSGCSSSSSSFEAAMRKLRKLGLIERAPGGGRDYQLGPELR